MPKSSYPRRPLRVLVRAVFVIVVLGSLISLACRMGSSADGIAQRSSNRPDSSNTVLENVNITTAPVSPSPNQSGKVELYEIPASKDALHFLLRNGLPKTIFIAYKGGEANGEAMFMPYDLRCPVGSRGESESVGPDFHFFPPQSPLRSGEEAKFTIRKPEARGVCSIHITYYDDEAVASLINEKGVEITDPDQTRIDKNRKILKLKFRVVD